MENTEILIENEAEAVTAIMNRLQAALIFSCILAIIAIITIILLIAYRKRIKRFIGRKINAWLDRCREDDE